LINLKNDDAGRRKIEEMFAQTPSSYDGTPTVDVLQNIVEDIRPILGERKVQVRVHTDGVPNGGMGKLDTWLQKNYVNDKTLTERVALTFNLCVGGHTEEDKEIVSHYERFIDPLKSKTGTPLMVDVVLPYHEARTRAVKANLHLNYDEGTHIVKSFLGSTNPVVDRVGEEGGTDVRRREGVINTQNVREQMAGQDGCNCTVS
jgi:hypothetical protein